MIVLDLIGPDEPILDVVGSMELTAKEAAIMYYYLLNGGFAPQYLQLLAEKLPSDQFVNVSKHINELLKIHKDIDLIQAKEPMVPACFTGVP